MIRRAAPYALVLSLLLTSAGAAQLRDLVGVQFDARVVSVIDGDTVDAIPAGEKRAIRIRLDGIDAPERGEPFNDAARRMTRVMLFDQNARLQGRAVDRYGRLVARVVVTGKDASLALLQAGLACHYVQYSSDPQLAAAEAKARRDGVGFWASSAAKPRCTRATSVAPPARPGASVFHGNTSSRVYHAPACPNYTCRSCTRVFRTEAEAQSAGFRPADDCLKRR